MVLVAISPALLPEWREYKGRAKDERELRAVVDPIPYKDSIARTSRRAGLACPKTMAYTQGIKAWRWPAESELIVGR
jgi:hypothetical protein